MNQKQLLGLIVAGLILGGVGYALYNKQKGGWQAAPKGSAAKLLGEFPINDVEQITVREATNTLTIVRSEGGWTVKERGGYTANFDEVHRVLTKVWELKPVQELKVGQSHLSRLNLQEPGKGDKTGTLLEFKAKDGKTHALLLGKEYSRESAASGPFGGGAMPSGRYVMVPGKIETVSLVSETFNHVDTHADHWLDKTFIKVERIKSIAYTPPEATNAWKVTRESESGEWKLADAKDAEKLDTAKVSGFNYLLSSPSFNDIAAPDAKPETTGMDKPAVATLETFDGFTYTLKIGKGPDDNTLHLAVNVTAAIPQQREAKPEEKDVDKQVLDKEFKEKKEKLEKKLADEQKLSKWTYLVTKWTVDQLMKDRKELLAEEKKEETPAAPPIPFVQPPDGKKEGN